jgi:hypothetical protein
MRVSATAFPFEKQNLFRTLTIVSRRGIREVDISPEEKWVHTFQEQSLSPRSEIGSRKIQKNVEAPLNSRRILRPAVIGREPDFQAETAFRVPIALSD